MMLLIAKRLGFEFITFFILATIYYKLFHKHEKWFKQSIRISLVLSIIWTILYCLDMVVFRWKEGYGEKHHTLSFSLLGQ